MRKNEFRRILLKQALLQKKAKALLIVLATAMGASVLAALLNLQVDLRHRMNRELRDYGPNVMLLPNEHIHSTYIEESDLSGLNRDRILALTPEVLSAVRVKERTAVLIGANLESLPKLYPGWKFDPAPSADSVCYIGVRLAKKLQISKGAALEFEVNGTNFRTTVSGTLESGEAEDDEIYLPLKTAQQMTGNTDHYQLVELSVLGEIAEVEKRFGDFTKAHPDVSFQLIRKIAAAEAGILDKISRLMSLVLLIIFVTLFFCINTTVSTILLSRQAEIALFRVLGARRTQITQELTLELLTLGFVGGVLGYLIGIAMAQLLGKILFQTWIEPRFSIFLITVFSSLAMMVLSSILPVRRAVNREAALVLKEA